MILARIKNLSSEVTNRGTYTSMQGASDWVASEEAKLRPFGYSSSSEYTKEYIDLTTSDDAEAVAYRGYLTRRQQDVDDKADIKTQAISAINNSNLPAWHKKLLRYLVRQIK